MNEMKNEMTKIAKAIAKARLGVIPMERDEVLRRAYHEVIAARDQNGTISAETLAVVVAIFKN